MGSSRILTPAAFQSVHARKSDVAEKHPEAEGHKGGGTEHLDPAGLSYTTPSNYGLSPDDYSHFPNGRIMQKCSRRVK